MRRGSGRKCRGNVKPAPFFLTPETVAGVVALSLRERTRAVQVPLLPIKLVDRPRSSPKLASKPEITRLDASHQPAVNDAAIGIVTIESTTTRSVASEAASGSHQGRAAEVTSGGVAGGCALLPANARHAQAGDPGLGPDRQLSLHISRHGAQSARSEPTNAALIRAAIAAREVLNIRSQRIGKSEAERIAKAYAAKALRQASQVPVAQPLLKPAPSREECPKCGVPGFRGCAHFLPCLDELLDGFAMRSGPSSCGPRV